MDEQNRNPSRADRKTVERNRRNQMKALYSTLNSLVPHQQSTEMLSLPDQLDEAVSYIKKLQIKLERMKEKKESLRGGCSSHDHQSSSIAASRSSNGGGGMAAAVGGLKLPHVDIHHVDSAVEVVLITGGGGVDCSQSSMFNDVLRMLHEEGADIISASFSSLDNMVFHTIHSQIEKSGCAYKAQRISERLHSFVNGAS
ncbi:PREDICTED: transcription factor bHLH125 [Ipomoea nil]|uniref:transcription factor bHLH125 n=1 Tax=Ipomoea nil TaxID=35883 RepID=UPI00090157B2|nr:PREDICTED: transcription factor bHLH125 [Ipomoea nil]